MYKTLSVETADCTANGVSTWPACQVTGCAEKRTHFYRLKFRVVNSSGHLKRFFSFLVFTLLSSAPLHETCIEMARSFYI